VIDPAITSAKIAGTAGKSLADTSRLATADNMKAATEKFEAIFLGMMLKSMRAPKLGEDLMGSSALDKFRDVQDEKLAQTLAGRMPLGLGKALGDFLAKGQPSLTAFQPSSVTGGKDDIGE
jgi:peptidoglycan hydrolase FlgJ